MREFLIRKTESGFQNIRAWKEYIQGLPAGSYKVKIEPADKRSLPQNAWFHSVLPEILQGLRDVGYDDVRTTEDAKDVVKGIFFKKTISNGVEDITVVEGTSKQSKINFAEKAEEIIKWAQEYLNINIAPPNHQLTIDA